MEFTAKGKLLLTGEYSVLRGALALSVPTTFGQNLVIEENPTSALSWTSLDRNGDVWFEAVFSNGTVISSSDQTKANTLLQILIEAKKLNEDFNYNGFHASTKLDFDRHWGLGSSSTLIALIADWANVDAMKLFFKSLSGSGYDVATAFTGLPILYQLIEGDAFIKSVPFSPSYKSELFFVYLGEKQDSAKEVTKFSAQKISVDQLNQISAITRSVLDAPSLDQFEDLMLEHEALTSIILDRPTIFETRFPDYPHIVKSLGAWGGDFVLATGGEKARQYFLEKGYQTILGWNEMIGM